jgi:hypothetical protein
VARAARAAALLKFGAIGLALVYGLSGTIQTLISLRGRAG